MLLVDSSSLGPKYNYLLIVKLETNKDYKKLLYYIPFIISF